MKWLPCSGRRCRKNRLSCWRVLTISWRAKRFSGLAPGGGGRGGGGAPFGGPGGGFGQAMKPIKTFVAVRAKSVNDQLAGTSEGATLSRSGPGGPPGGRGGPGVPPGMGGPPGRGGPGGFGPGMFLAQAFTTALDADKDGTVTQAEFTQGFLKWLDRK